MLKSWMEVGDIVEKSVSFVENSDGFVENSAVFRSVLVVLLKSGMVC